MKKRNFLIGKKVVITSPENKKETIVVKIKDSIIQKANTQFVYKNGEGTLCTFEFEAIQEMYKATPASQKVFSKMKSAFANRPRIKNIKMPSFKMPKVSVKFA